MEEIRIRNTESGWEIQARKDRFSAKADVTVYYPNATFVLEAVDTLLKFNALDK